MIGLIMLCVFLFIWPEELLHIEPDTLLKDYLVYLVLWSGNILNSSTFSE